MRAPAFWWESPGFQAAALAPLGAIYGAIAGARLKQKGAHASVPVICIGDPTVGGAGKTPTAIAVAEILLELGEKPFFVTRGYGGTEKGPMLVNILKHGAQDVGDEPLLLAAVAPVVVSADRVAGAKLAAESGASVIVMDDGFQNPALSKDFSLLVIDGASGVGNGLVFPAGPLRAPLKAQIERAGAVVLIGGGEKGESAARQAARSKAILRAHLSPEPESVAEIKDAQILAYAGIGRPAKFFATLEAAGCRIMERREFPDHHPYTESDARELLDTARARHLTLVTTAKDHARMYKNAALNELADASRVLPVDLHFEDEAALKALVQAAIKRRAR